VFAEVGQGLFSDGATYNPKSSL